MLSCLLCGVQSQAMFSPVHNHRSFVGLLVIAVYYRCCHELCVALLTTTGYLQFRVLSRATTDPAYTTTS